MFIKSNIRKVTIALEKTTGHEAYVRLGKAGIIHLSRLQPVDGLADREIMTEEGKVRDIIAGTVFAVHSLQIETGEDVTEGKARDSDTDALVVTRAKKTLERLQRLRAGILEKADAVSVQREYGEALARMGIDPGAIKRVRLVQMVFGQVEGMVPDVPFEGPFIMAGADRYLVAAALPPDAPRMLEILKEHGFIDKTSDISGVSLERLKVRENALKRRLEILDRYTNGIREEMGPALLRLYHSYRGYEEVLKAMRLSMSSSRAMFITGWIDAREKQRLVSILREICGERFILSDQPDPDAPVRLRNIPLFKPFELIVKIMGMPANSEIDPTPLAAVTFVLIFGLMFGDLGQGLVLAMTGLIVKGIAGKKAQENLGHAGGILFACGLSAAFCGVLYGSCFSSEHLITALWMHPVKNIMGLFSAVILLGAVIIVIGLCGNIVNAVINADYTEALLGKKGAVVLIFYSAVVLLSIRYATVKQAPALWEISVFIILPLLLFSLRGVLGPILFQAPRPHDIAEYVTETVMEVVEIAISMFANTISFIRVGAFALSHAGLSTVTYTLAGMADPRLQSPGAIAILVAGNIFIIGFEGLICGIQSMRLEFYEFFSKFFKGDGVVFSPFTLKTKISEV